MHNLSFDAGARDRVRWRTPHVYGMPRFGWRAPVVSLSMLPSAARVVGAAPRMWDVRDTARFDPRASIVALRR